QLQNGDDARLHVEVQDQLGRVVLRYEADHSDRSRFIALPLDALANGVYYYTITASKDGAQLWTSAAQKFQVIR
ncbi:MAG TPA: hypothetical protein VFH43_14070, partial [Candidatus Kapabacteria bacterium]|nr:hypothetical protein [Candidatus Kapabacteria bacterium]